MRFSTILILASMTSALACGADDSDDTGAGTDTDPTTTMSTTDPSTTTMSTTDPSTTVDPSSSTDPSTTVDPSSSTDPSTTEPGTETSGDPDTGSTGEENENCVLYCTVFIASCQDANGGLDGADPYTDMDACMTTCEGFELGTEGDTTGNTLACRGYHLEVALMMPGAGHCGHADADGTGMCV
jgi:hypothetical protein